MRFQKIYVEISNVCNLKCSFCPGTKRPVRRMTVEEFSALMPKLRPYTDYLYFHLMGEPLCHPNLQDFLRIAGELLSAPALHKVNISLHAFEANIGGKSLEDYVRACLDFGKASAGRKIVVYRLWNQGGQDALNGQILEQLHAAFPQEWEQQRQGIKIAERTFLEYGDKFDWPDLSAREGSHRVFCYGLRDQLGVLCDGTVVPCCLDHEGDIALGNVFSQELEEILGSPRAKAIYNGFSHREAMEPLCRRCGYARRFE